MDILFKLPEPLVRKIIITRFILDEYQYIEKIKNIFKSTHDKVQDYCNYSHLLTESNPNIDDTELLKLSKEKNEELINHIDKTMTEITIIMRKIFEIRNLNYDIDKTDLLYNKVNVDLSTEEKLSETGIILDLKTTQFEEMMQFYNLNSVEEKRFVRDPTIFY